MTSDSPQSAAPVPRSRLRLWLVAMLCVGALVYFGSDSLAVYTDDAYVQSDFVPISAEVEGLVEAVSVTDNQSVKAGDRLLQIAGEPFRLDLALKEDRVASALSDVSEKEATAAGTASRIDAANAALLLAQQDYDRVKPLVADQALSQEELNRATDQLQSAKDGVAEARANADIARRQVDTATAAVATARAEQAVAAYALSRTDVKAPVDGYVTNLTLRPGTYAKTGTPLIGIVDAKRFRIVANFKEYVAASLDPGKPAWIWLDSRPWRLFQGRVESVGRGIARSDVPGGLLPYVAPTTNWIRLVRRLPVTIVFEALPADVDLHMGADARVLIVR